MYILRVCEGHVDPTAVILDTTAACHRYLQELLPAGGHLKMRGADELDVYGIDGVLVASVRFVSRRASAIGLDVGIDGRVTIRPLRADVVDIDDFPEDYRNNTMLYALANSGVSINSALRVLLDERTRLVNEQLQQILTAPAAVRFAWPVPCTDDNVPLTRPDANRSHRNYSSPVLAVVGGRPMLVRYWDAADPDDSPKCGWESYDSNAWDVSGRVDVWYPLPAGVG